MAFGIDAICKKLVLLMWQATVSHCHFHWMRVNPGSYALTAKMKVGLAETVRGEKDAWKPNQ